MFKKVQKGFTLIELVIVMVIIGILAAVALPKFVDLSGSANDAAGKGGAMGAQTAFAAAIAQNAPTSPADPFPTVTQVAANGQGLKALAGGLCVADNMKAITYTDEACSTATTAVTDKVKCVSKTAESDSNC